MTDAKFSSAFTSNHSFDLLISHLLHSFRVRTDMEVAFISEFANGRRVFRYIDNARDVDIIKVGGSDPLDQSYCQKVVTGVLPELIQDAQLNSVACTMEATRLVPVGGHISVPIYLSSGQIFGTYCAFCRYSRMDLSEKDIELVRIYADITASLIENSSKSLLNVEADRNKINNMLETSSFYEVFQPIFHLHSNKVWGYEALTRFIDSDLTPDKVFDQADEFGLGYQLGVATMKRAIAESRYFPPNVYLNLNSTPSLILSGALNEIFAQEQNLSRYVLELTEHVIVDDYQEIQTFIEPLRKRGLRLAVDDAGAGYASFRHILLLKPDIIKLDISLIRDIHKSDEKQALTTALVAFSKRGKHLLIAEGVETEEELAILRELNVDLVQGYLFSKPLSIEKLFPQAASA